MLGSSSTLNLLAPAQERAAKLNPPCYISFQADFIRNAPGASARGVMNLMEKKGKTDGWLFETLSNEVTIKSLKEQHFVGGLREHPARFPCVTNMYELLLLAHSYVPNAEADCATQLQQINAGLMGFAAEIKTVSFLPQDSPFRIKADTDIFGCEEAFAAAVQRSMKVIADNWGSRA